MRVVTRCGSEVGQGVEVRVVTRCGSEGSDRVWK